MPAPFDDVKPFPGQHHNDPPLDARVTMDFHDALIARDLLGRVTAIIESADRTPDPIENADQAGKAADLVAMARDAKQAVDAEREILNRPLLIAQRSLKGKADGIIAPMEAAVATVRDRLDDWVASNDAPALGDYGAKASARESWDFEVVDYARLPVVVRRHPDVLSAIDKVIRAQVRGGARRMAGVRIYPVTKAAVR